MFSASFSLGFRFINVLTVMMGSATEGVFSRRPEFQFNFGFVSHEKGLLNEDRTGSQKK